MKFFKSISLALFCTSTVLFPLISCKENYRQETITEKKNLQIQFSNAPSWVEEMDYESDCEENITSPGIAHLLIDRQFNLDERIYYSREVNKIVSKAALTDAAQIPIVFNSRDLDLIIHSIKIIRDGRVIDKLLTAKRQFFYPSSGNTTEVFFYIDNLHIGDILDLSYSYKIKNNSTTQLLGDTFNIKDYAVYKKIAYSCLIGKDKPLVWKMHLFEQDPVCIVGDSYKKYSWEINDYKIHFLPPSEFPKISSSQPVRDPSINISTKSWNDIAKYSALLLDEKTHFSSYPPQNIVELVREWQSNYPDVEEQILAAIRLVSDDIYYASIPDEEKEHAITPYSPEKTLENHYGDCKDKSSLLIAILKLLGVEAYPVLVSTEKTYNLKDELPTPCFDHLITKIEYNGKSYFIDPTQSLFGGTLDTYQIPDYGYGLIAQENSEDLIPITRNFLSKIKSVATISIQGRDVTWDHEVQLFHKLANNMRNKFVPGYVNKESKFMLTDLVNLFPNGEVVYRSPLTIEDDRQANIITKNFSFSLKNIGEKT
ncbi:MAG: DUF3857 domain-containing protein, partial [Chlamydiales bacterium]